MKKHFLSYLFILLCVASVQAQTLTASVTGTTFCNNAPLTVTYTSTGTTYQSGNVFSVQLSDASGSFANYFQIGQFSGTAASGSITSNFPAISGTGYRVRVVASNPAVTGTDNGTDLTINQAPPVPVASNNSPVCAGTTLALSAVSGAGVTYTWSHNGADVFFTQHPAIPSATLADAGTWTVTAHQNGCISQAVTNVVVNSSQVVFFETMGPAAVVSPTLVSLHEAANNFDNDDLTMTGTVSASNPGIGTQVGANSNPSFGYAGASGGNYVFLNFNSASVPSHWFEISDINTLGMSDLTLSFGVKKQAAASNGSQLVVEYSTDGTTYTPLPWGSPLPVGNGTQVPWYGIDSIQGIPATQNLRLRWRQTANNMSFQIDDIKLVNGALQPTITTNGAATLCGGNPVMLTATAGSAYSWSSGQTTQIISVTQAGNYSVSVTGGSGCVNTTQPYTVSANPPAPQASVNSPVCEGQDIMFTVSSASVASYSWVTPGGVVFSTQQNPVIPNAALAHAGVYTVHEIHGNGCVGIGYVPVQVNSLPAVSAMSNSPVCAGSTLQLSTITVQGATYLWTGPASFTSTLQNPARQNATPSMAGTYQVFVTANGCTSEDTVHVQVVQQPPAPMPNTNAPICAGQTLQIFAPGSGMYEFTLPDSTIIYAPQLTIPNAQVSDGGTYKIRDISNGCFSPYSFLILTVQASPTVAVTASADTVSSGDLVTLQASGASSYYWIAPSSGGLNGSTLSQVTASPTATTTYTVIGINTIGCSDSAFVTVYVGLVSAPDATEQTDVLQIFPNPSSGNFFVQLTDCQPGAVEISVLNALGQQVHREAATAKNTALEHKLSVTKLPAGLYILQVKQGDRVLTKRLVLQK